MSERMQDLETVKAFVNSVEGWLSEAEIEFLYQQARLCTGAGAIVEIGSWKGKSTICLAAGARNGAGVRVFAIDPHTGASEHRELFGTVWTFDEFRANLERSQLGSGVTPIVATSAEAADRFDLPVEFIFIDGAHEYEWVRLDLEKWLPKVVEGGTVAFHDSTRAPGIIRLLNESVFPSPHFRQFGLVHSITYARKSTRRSWVDGVHSRRVWMVKSLYEWAIKFRWPFGLRTLGQAILRRVR